MAVAGKTKVMASLRGMEIVDVPLEEACAEVRSVPPELFDVAATFFG
jgi:hypothetical protein